MLIFPPPLFAELNQYSVVDISSWFVLETVVDEVLNFSQAYSSPFWKFLLIHALKFKCQICSSALCWSLQILQVRILNSIYSLQI
jgi:hypothetical protein